MKMVEVKIKNKPNELKAVAYLGGYSQHKGLLAEVIKTLDWFDEVDKKIRDVKDYPLSKNRSELTSVYINNIVTDTVLAGIRQYSGKHPFVQVANLDLSVLKYGVGGHYKWHVDAGTTLNRSLSVIITLNNDYEGGNLLFSPTQEKEDQITIKPGVGKMIIWPSNFMYPHQVEPITKGKRYSIVGWLW